MKLVIGIVGENGAGKGTVTSILAVLAHDKKVAKVRFSDILYKTLEMWNIPATRENLQNLPIAMVKMFGDGTLTRAVQNHINNQNADLIIAEGIRWTSDVPMIKSFNNSYIIYVTADPKIRFERMKARGEKVGEKGKTYNKFLKEETAKTEVNIKKIGEKADYKVENNQDIATLKNQLIDIYKKIIL